jgi:hypothetical protein
VEEYTVAQAARVLGVSPKRVRQLIAEGRLTPVPGSSPTALPASAVHAERERRRNRVPASTPGPDPTPQPLDLDLETLLEYARATTRLALEAGEADRAATAAARDRVEQLLRDQIAEERATVAALRAEVADLRERLAKRERKAKGKGWKKRGK